MSSPAQPAAVLKLLIVDDDEIDRAQVHRNLRKAAAHVDLIFEEAESAEQAQAAAARTHFDCILLDYLLPGARATELLPALSALLPDAAIVVLTGQGDETIAVELMKAGAADYLPKDGLDPARLWSAIRYAVALSKVKRDTAQFELARRRRAAQLRALVDAAPAISGALSPEQLARTAADRAREVLGVAATFVILRNRETEATALSAGPSCAPALADVRNWALLCRAHRGERQPLRVRIHPSGETGALVVALYARDGGVVGAMATSEPSDPGESEACEQILAQLAQIVSVALDNSCLLRETQDAVRARDEVLAVVSHDLRTPLTNVRLGLALLRDVSAASETSLHDRIERSVHHMTRLVDDLVDLARIEGSRLDMNPRGEPVHELVHAACALAQPSADAARVQLLPRPVPSELRARVDRHRALQVLSNLLGNAIKFTPVGGSVSLVVEDRAEEVCFHVQDSGCGISSEDAPHVFARFFRGPGARQGGLGLGLYIARALVEAHGGSIWFTSTPGAGTTFSFTLPAEGRASDAGTLLESANG